MRIDNNALNLAQALGESAQVRGSGNSDRASASSASGDRVQLSSFAQLAMGDSPRVRQLASDYDAGSYNLSPQQIAASMIGEMLEA